MPMPTRSIAASLILSLAASGTFAQAHRIGTPAAVPLIGTERGSAAGGVSSPSELQAQRSALVHALVATGLSESSARARVQLLSHDEVAGLAGRLNDAPAGGAWFAPFLVVAALIALLISTRDAPADASTSAQDAPAGSDLFGRPRAAGP